MTKISHFNFNTISRFLGYNSSIDKTRINPRFMVRGSKNVYKKDSGTIAVRPGLKRRGAADTTTEGVIASWDWETSTGKNRQLRIANSKLQVESDILVSGTHVWYDLMTGLASDVLRHVFDAVWDNTVKRDFLVFVRGDTNLFKWSGGMGTIVSTTANSITLNAAAASLGFDTSGSVIINGTTYTYSGVTSATLTGVGTDPTGEADGSVVTAAVVTNATKPDSALINDFLKVINNQVYVGSYTSRLVYVSANDDYTDYTVPDPIIAGSPELLTLDNLARGIGIIGGEAYISAGFSDWYRVRFKLINVETDGLTRQTVVDKLEAPGLGAAMGHEYITNAGNSIAYLTRDKKVRQVGVFTNLNKISFPTLSLPIKTELFNETFNPVQGETSDGEVCAVGDKIYVTSVSGGTTYIYETRERLNERGEIASEKFWQPPFIWGISRIAVIDGVEYGHSIANPQIYQLWDTEQWHDDSPEIATSEGPNSPGTMTNETSVGTVSWINVNNAKASDDNDAYVPLFNETSKYLKATNFGFSIPDGAIIVGIKVEIEEGKAGPGTPTENSIKIVKGGTIGGDDKSTGATIPTTDTYVEYGSSTDLWGLEWTSDDINSSGFGVVFSGSATAAGNSIYVDHIRITVSYTQPSDPLPYDCVMRMAYRHGKKRTDIISFDMIVVEGYMPEGTQLKARFYGDYQGATTLQELWVNKTTKPENRATFFTGFSAPSMGDSPLGENPLGEGLTEEELSQEQLPKFRKIVNVAQVDVFEYGLEIYTEDVDSRWEILALGTNAQKSKREPTFIRG